MVRTDEISVRLAEPYWDDGITADEDTINKKLMISAPDLLAELKRMYEREDALVSAIKELCDSEDSTGCSGDLTVVELDPMFKLYELTSE
jgi:hypothetical protein